MGRKSFELVRNDPRKLRYAREHAVNDGMSDWVAWWLGWSNQHASFLILMGDLKLLPAKPNKSQTPPVVVSE